MTALNRTSERESKMTDINTREAALKYLREVAGYTERELTSVVDHAYMRAARMQYEYDNSPPSGPLYHGLRLAREMRNDK